MNLNKVLFAYSPLSDNVRLLVYSASICAGLFLHLFWVVIILQGNLVIFVEAPAVSCHELEYLLFCTLVVIFHVIVEAPARMCMKNAAQGGVLRGEPHTS